LFPPNKKAVQMAEPRSSSRVLKRSLKEKAGLYGYAGNPDTSIKKRRVRGSNRRRKGEPDSRKKRTPISKVGNLKKLIIVGVESGRRNENRRMKTHVRERRQKKKEAALAGASERGRARRSPKSGERPQFSGAFLSWFKGPAARLAMVRKEEGGGKNSPTPPKGEIGPMRSGLFITFGREKCLGRKRKPLKSGEKKKVGRRPFKLSSSEMGTKGKGTEGRILKLQLRLITK